MSSQVHTEMSQQVYCALAEDPVEDVFRHMKELGVRHLPVVKGGQLIGVVSDRDIYLAAKKEAELITFPASLRIKDIMTVSAISCRPNARLGDVADLMLREHIDALPVTTTSNELIGIITTTDLVRHLRRAEGVRDETAISSKFTVKRII